MSVNLGSAFKALMAYPLILSHHTPSRYIRSYQSSTRSFGGNADLMDAVLGGTYQFSRHYYVYSPI
jgi:hypothetical protein